MERESIPPVAIIANSVTPYRLHLHRRIARELPQIKLFSVFTHGKSDSPWPVQAEAEINPVMFGPDESAENQSNIGGIFHEWKKSGRIIRWMSENKIAAVLLLGYNDIGRLRIWRWCAKHRIPLFLWGDSNIRGDFARGLRGFVKRQLLSRVLRDCNFVFPCGSLGAEYFRKYGATENQIIFMPVEPDYQLIQQINPQQIAQTMEAFHLDPQRRRIVYSGRLAAVKRVDLLIDAFTQIASKRPEWDLLIIGDGPLRNELRERVPAELKNRIFWTGFLNDQLAISALYRGSDILVLPSDYEPWALVINEAAAAGMAIVCSDVVGAAAELVEDGVNGLKNPPNDLPALTNSLMDATQVNRIDEMKRASPILLQRWQQLADPVAGFRQALTASGVIASIAPTS